MSRGDRRAPSEGLADLPIRHPAGARQGAESGSDRARGAKRPRRPANLELFDDSPDQDELLQDNDLVVDIDPPPPAELPAHVTLDPATPDWDRDPAIRFEDRSDDSSDPAVEGRVSAVEEASSFLGTDPSWDLGPSEPATGLGPSEITGFSSGTPEPGEPDPPSSLDRLLAALADALVHLATLSIALLAMVLLRLVPSVSQWPGFASFLFLFSLLYFTLPLAFWGHTPGMAWRQLRARDRQGRALTFGQTALRFLAAWLTVALAGLPLIFVLTKATFADRLSASTTERRRHGGS